MMAMESTSVRRTARGPPRTSAETYAASFQPPYVSRTNTIASPNAAVPVAGPLALMSTADAVAPSPSVSAASATATTPPISTIANAFCMRDEPLSPTRLMPVSSSTAPRGVQGRGVRAEREQACEVVAEDEAEQGDRTGADHGAARPREQEAHALAVGAREKRVVAARARIRRSELRVSQRTDERQRAAEHPGDEHGNRRAGDAGDQHGCFEDARTDHDADRDHRGIEDAERRRRRLASGSLARGGNCRVVARRCAHPPPSPCARVPM